jgi:hypothetical protein
MEFGWSADVAQRANALLDRLEPELVAVEGARPLEVLSGLLEGRQRRVAASRKAESSAAPDAKLAPSSMTGRAGGGIVPL